MTKIQKAHELVAGAGKKLRFEHVPLEFEDEKYTDVFSAKNNKSLGETLDHYRYRKLKPIVLPKYESFLDVPLGEFLAALKHKNDKNYCAFLNKYGDLIYSQFWIANSAIGNQAGVYAYYLGNVLQYIGRCTDSLEKRVNQGYGKIHPKNCYLDGQATNCRLNAETTEARDGISLWFSPHDSVSDIEALEKQLIGRYKPRWNIQRP